MLHLLNGDATAAAFPSALPGDRAVWRDLMVEGPAVDDGAARAACLAARLGITADAYERGWREGRAILERAATHDEIVLWFEQDLCCAVNLWFVLDRLRRATAVSLVFPPLSDTFAGLGSLTSDAFLPLLAGRSHLDEATRDDARALWHAYAAPEPTTLARTRARLPFTDEAVRLHLGRFPSTTHGLDEIETATLRSLGQRPHDFPELFRAVMQAPPLRRHGMGDVQYAAALRDLRPLVAIADAGTPFAEWRVSLTPTGVDVLGGHLDGLASRALDRWLGGVHLRPGGPRWRWSGSRILEP